MSGVYRVKRMITAAVIDWRREAVRSTKRANQNGLARRGAGRVEQPSRGGRLLAGFEVATERGE